MIADNGYAGAPCTFKSTAFSCFLAVAYLLSAISSRKVRNLLMLGASCFFHGYWGHRFLGLLALSTSVAYFAAQELQATDATKVRRGWLWSSLSVNLGAFAFFNYIPDKAAKSANCAFGVVVPIETMGQ